MGEKLVEQGIINLQAETFSDIKEIIHMYMSEGYAITNIIYEKLHSEEKGDYYEVIITTMYVREEE